MSHLTQTIQDTFVVQAADGLLVTQAFAFPSAVDC